MLKKRQKLTPKQGEKSRSTDEDLFDSSFRIRVESWKERALKEFLPHPKGETKSVEPLAGGLGPASSKLTKEYGSLAERTLGKRSSRARITSDDLERAPVEMKETSALLA